MTEGRHILARAILPRIEGGYAGVLLLWGFRYGIEVRRHADGVEVTAFDGPVAESHRIAGSMMRKTGFQNEARGFAFKILHTEAGNRNVARFACVECGDCLDISNSNGGKPAEWFVARAARQGWAADTRNRNKCYCPRCINDAKAKYMAPTLENTSASVIALRPVPQPAQQEADPVSAAKQQPRDPTNDERVRIRTHLDKSFDDATGTYLDGMSDQEIGRLENIPWAIVTRIREAAYGPIRTDPELMQLRAQMADLLDRVDQMRAALDGYGRKVAA